MSEPRIQHPTVADIRDMMQRIISAAGEVTEYLDLYEQVYADDINDEIVHLLQGIAVMARGASRRQCAVHGRSAELIDSVTHTIDQLPTTGSGSGYRDLPFDEGDGGGEP